MGDADTAKVAVSYAKITSAVSAGSSIIVDQGACNLEVTEVKDKHVVTVCKNAYKMGENAVLRVPGATIDMSPLTE